MTTARPDPAAATGAVGTAHTRVEGRAKVTGAARYAGEIPFAELAHGWLVLSTVARGRIRAVETAPVLAMPGVLAVLHHGNAPRVDTDYVGLLGARPDRRRSSRTTGCRTGAGRWRWSSPRRSEQAREAAEALVVHYDEEPHDVAFAAGHPGRVHAGRAPTAPAVTEKGDLEAELAASAVVVDAEYTTPEEHHNPMEPHAATARWDGGRLEVVDSNQGSHAGSRRNSPQLFSLDPASVRVRSEHVGGGFGSQGRPRRTRWLAVMAATVLRPPGPGRPDPPADVLAGRLPQPRRRSGSGSAPTPTGGCARSTTETLSLTSTVHEFVEPSAGTAGSCTTPTRHHTANRVVRLDVPTPTCMRAPGEAPGSFALESAHRRTRREVRPRPDRAARPQRARGRARVRAAVQQPQPASPASEEGARRFGWADRDPRPGRAPRRAAGCSAPARRRPPSPRASAPSTAAVTAEAGRHLHRTDHRGRHRDRRPYRARP